MKKESISVKVIASKHQPKERILMMTTLTQKPLHFNRSIQLSSDGGALSSDTGELICREFDEKLGLCLYRNNLLLSKTNLYLLLLFAR